MGLLSRDQRWDLVADTAFDVAVVGGGIHGACLYHHLSLEGYRVLLIDKADFASGTSQGSAMMVWGGLLYLRNWEFATVRKLCDSRDRMVRDMGEWVRPRTFRYLHTTHGRLRPSIVHAGLYFYWALGGCHRLRPYRQRNFPERGFLKGERVRGSAVYEEACLEPSDARFVLQWILSHQEPPCVALNYCFLQGGGYDRAAGNWRLELTDTVRNRQCLARARWVVNATGIWADAINRRFGTESRHKNVFCKGVFIAVPRDPRHRAVLIFETRTGKDWLSLIPWGPVSLWGPTEAVTSQLEESFVVAREDIRLLLEELNPHLAHPVQPRQIVSTRCGVRALAVDRRFTGQTFNSLDLSRRYWIDTDPHLPWISLFGGKVTDCVRLASSVTRILQKAVERPSSPSVTPPPSPPRPEWQEFPGLPEKVLAASWCAENEMCCTLEDYLRRRTNVAQWVPRGGLGVDNQNIPHLLRLATVFAPHQGQTAQAVVAAYRRKIEAEFDEVLANV